MSGAADRGHQASGTSDRTFDSALTLGLIVLVRTFLSFSLEIELEGALPWRRGSTGKRPDAPASAGRRVRISDAAGKLRLRNHPLRVRTPSPVGGTIAARTPIQRAP